MDFGGRIDPAPTSHPDELSSPAQPTTTEPYSQKPTKPSMAVQQQRKRKLRTPGVTTVKSFESPSKVRSLSGTSLGSDNMSLSDKKRNKLGYHRTSVACGKSTARFLAILLYIATYLLLGHCRRRKIRCLVANDNPHGKCANCIRLKKECNFFPVDQQPQPERRQRTSSKGVLSSKENTISSSSSPGMHGAPIMESMERYQPYQPIHMGSTPELNFNDPLTSHEVSPIPNSKSNLHAQCLFDN